MTAVLRYGAAEAVEFDLPDGVLVADCSSPRGTPVSDVAVAVRAAIDAPLDFPPLVLAAVPGDKIVLAVDPAVPSLPTVVATIVEALLVHGAQPEEIGILQTRAADGPASNSPGDDPRSALPAAVRKAVSLLTHDPDNADEHCHLLNLPDGEEVRIHRSLFDADLIVPIGCLRVKSAWEYAGVHGCLFPAFGDAASQRRFRESAAASPTPRKKRLSDVHEVAWNMGVVLTVQVIPGAGEKILHVLCGEPRSVAKQGAELCAAAWRFDVPHRADLVVLGLEGNAEQQTWENVARAVASALPLVAEEGVLAVCSELATPPGPALRRLVGAEDSAVAVKRIRKQHTADAPAAMQLARSLEQTKIFLLSRLDADDVEELGLAPVAEAGDIARLARRSASCILLSNAQFAVGKLTETTE